MSAAATRASRTQPADRVAVVSLGEALCEARRAGDRRPAFVVIADCLDELGVALARCPTPAVSLGEARTEWLARVASSRRSQSALVAYRAALEDLLRWLDQRDPPRDAFAEQTLVAYLEDYRRRACPAPATYYRRFVLLRRFYRWFSRRAGVPDPFADLEAPPKPIQSADWLTPAEFELLLEAANAPTRNRRGLARRDRLVLLALVATGLRRSELIALDWRDLDLEGPRPSLAVRHGKGGRPRRQPLAPALAAELARVREELAPAGDEPVFCGLEGGRLQPTILANIIRRAAQRAGVKKRVTAHTLRHSAATWLRHATGDARLVAEYLGHADLSTVHRYTHVAEEELHAAAGAICAQIDMEGALRAPELVASVPGAVRSAAGQTGRARRAIP